MKYRIVSYYCRHCNKITYHAILCFDEMSLPQKNLAKLSCIKCDTQGFVVEYDKQATAPTSASKRVSEVIGDDVHYPVSDWF